MNASRHLARMGRVWSLVILASMWTGSRATVQAVPRSPALPPLKEIQPPDALVGDVVTLVFDGDLPVGAKPEVKIGGQRAVLKTVSGNKLEVRVPDLDAKPANNDYEITLDGQGLQPPRTLGVFPPPNASVTDIRPERIRVGPDATEVKVTGAGFSAPRDKIVLRIGGEPAETQLVASDGTWFSALLRGPRTPGEMPIAVSLWGVPAQVPDQLQVKVEVAAEPWTIVGLAVLPLVLVAGLIWLLYRTVDARRPGLTALLLEPENQTYSLSRAQFLWWLTAIVFVFLFLFFAQGLIEGNWTFPSLSGSPYLLLISLGTLVAVQATSRVKGVKGAGKVHPSPSDLVTHGGVLALERVQQVVWTFLAGLAFVVIAMKTYLSAGQMPTVPRELLVLMGISSAGYLGGKIVRQPGPVIDQVLASVQSGSLRIHGSHLSRGALVCVNGQEQPSSGVSVLDAGPNAREFAETLEIKLPKANADWLTQPPKLTVRNVDGQVADWAGQPRLEDDKTA